MPYEPIVFQNEPAKVTPISAEALAQLQQQYPEAIKRENHTGKQVWATISDGQKAVEGILGSKLAAGTNVTITYNATTGVTTVNSTGGGTSGGTVGVDANGVFNVMGDVLFEGTNVNIEVNEATKTIILSTDATKNSTDAQLRDRSTHTGRNPWSGAPIGSAGFVRQSTGGTYTRLSDSTQVGYFFIGVDRPPVVVAPAVNGMYDNIDAWIRVAV